MKLIQEFKQFAVKGNVVDMAVGVIIGGAFGKIVSSIVSDIIMPPIGVLLGNVNFTDLKIVIRESITASDGAVTPAVTINYGSFLQVLIDFLIIAWVIFLAIKLFNRQKKDEAPAPAPPAEPSEDIKLLTEIRDLLKK